MNPVLLLRLLLSVYPCCFVAWLQRSAAWLLLPGNFSLSLMFLNCTTISLPGHVFLNHIIWHLQALATWSLFYLSLKLGGSHPLYFCISSYVCFFLSLWASSSIKCCHFSVSLQVILLHIFHLCIPNWRFLGLLPCFLGHWFVLY